MRNNFEKINFPYNPDKIKSELRTYAQKACDYIRYLAEEAGAEKEKFVRNAVRIIQAFAYDHGLINKQVGMVEQRLRRRIELKERGQYALPGPEIFVNDIKIGTLAKNPKQDVSLSLGELNRNTFLSGKTGEGKTNIIFNTIPQLVRKKVFTLIFDFKLMPEYRDLLQLPECSNMAVLPVKKLDKDNIFDPQGENIDGWFLFVWEILQQSYDIKQPTQIMLINYCKRLYHKQGIFGMRDLESFLKQELFNPTVPKSEKNKIQTCLKAISVILLDAGSMLDCKQGYFFKDIFEKFDLSCYELNNISEKGRQWIIKFKLRRLHQVLSEIRRMNRLNMVIVIDEAKMLFGKNAFQSRHLDYIKQLFTQGRGAYGLGWIISDQSYTSELADFVVENIENHICLKHSLPSQAKSAAFVMGCDASEILMLHRPIVLMRKGNWPYHFGVWIPKAKISRHITDEEVKREMGNRLKKLNYIPSRSQKHSRVRLIGKVDIKSREIKETRPKVQNAVQATVPHVRKNPLEVLERFLKYIKANSGIKLTAIYKALNFSGRKGDNMKNIARDNDLIKEQRCQTGRKGRPLIELELTEKGKEYINEK